jgi:hypothetical protein
MRVYSFQVGDHLVCSMIKVGEGLLWLLGWWPGTPHMLTDEEMDDYRRGRDQGLATFTTPRPQYPRMANITDQLQVCVNPAEPKPRRYGGAA